MDDGGGGERAARRETIWRVVALPAAVAFLVFANTLAHGFVWDDPIVLNWLDDRTWALPALLRSERPLTYAVHALDRRLWGEWPPGYHLTNVLLHVAATSLATVAALRLTRSRWAAAACGLVFAVHPVHVEVVANVSNRKDAIAMVFAMAALLVWLRPGRGWGRSAACFALFALGIYAKEVAVAMLPAMLFAADLILPGQEGGPRRRAARAAVQLAPLLAVAAVVAVVFAGDLLGYFAAESIAAKSDHAYDTVGASLSTAAANLRHVVRLLVFPRFLSIDYPIEPHTSFDGAVLAGLGLLAAWLAAIAWTVRRAPVVGFGLCWTLVMVLPCANVVPLHHILVAERYLYVPSFGVALVAGQVFARGLAAARATRAAWVPAAALGLVLVAGAGRTLARNGDWRDWQALIAAGERDGIDTWRLHKTVAAWAVRREDHAEAARRYARAIALRPGDPELAYWHAVSLYRIGDLDRALEEYRRTLALDAEKHEAHYGMGLILAVRGELPAAIQHFRETIRRDRDYAPAHMNLGMALRLSGQYDSAASAFRETIRCAPDSVDAHLNLGDVLRTLGDREGTLEAFREAVRSDGGNLLALQELGDTAAELGLVEEAMQAYRRICVLRPADVETLEKLGALHERIGDHENAAATYEVALRYGKHPRIESRLRALRTREGD